MPKPHLHKSTKNILIAFLLNLGFSIYEFIGGTLTHSVAIVSDAIHDLGDALSIGISFVLEKKSQRRPDQHYTYGYIRYSLVGGLITTCILLGGSIFVIFQAISRLIHPVEIQYDGMIVLAVVGVVVNFCAAYFTRDGDSLNQKSVNLHMLEDVLGWVVVLVGAIIMRFTGFDFIDPLLSIFVAIFIFKAALTNFFTILNVFLEKAPSDLDLEHLQAELLALPEVESIHHLHVWSIDGYHHYATVHAVSQQPTPQVKDALRHALHEHNIEHVTIELEAANESCAEPRCPELHNAPHHHHHH